MPTSRPRRAPRRPRLRAAVAATARGGDTEDFDTKEVGDADVDGGDEDEDEDEAADEVVKKEEEAAVGR